MVPGLIRCRRTAIRVKRPSGSGVLRRRPRRHRREGCWWLVDPASGM